MSIKLKLARLRSIQKELDQQIEKLCSELIEEEVKQKSLSDSVMQFSTRKTELATKLYKEYETKLKCQIQKVHQIRIILEAYKEKYWINEEKIRSYLEDTSFYIDEQVSYLIKEFLRYVEKNEIELGNSITSNFEIAECKQIYRGCRGSYEYIPDGNFFIKRVVNEKETEEVVATKDYYFERKICEAHWDENSESIQVNIESWYAIYAEDFKKAFISNLAVLFESRNFKLTFKGYSFSLNLI